MVLCGMVKDKVKGFFADFKKFISKGNVVNLAVAVVIGAAFGKIVTSFVNDIVMPLITLAVGGSSVAEWKWVITPATYDGSGVLLTAENALRYGIFIQAIIDFLIIAFCIFIALKIAMNLQHTMEGLAEDFKKLNSKERKLIVKELKQQGKTKKEIKEELAKRELEAKAEAARIAEEKKLEEEKNKPQTSEQLLSEIRDILKKKN